MPDSLNKWHKRFATRVLLEEACLIPSTASFGNEKYIQSIRLLPISDTKEFHYSTTGMVGSVVNVVTTILM